MRLLHLLRIAVLLVWATSVGRATPPDGNRLTYLDGCDPYYPHLNFARLTTPQWVGEEGVEAVVVLAIDDMKGNTGRYEAFLRPILDRLKAIDGRAPVSIMTNGVDPDDPQLQAWLKEGLAIDVHTLSHPCPLLQKGDFAAAARDVHGCVDLLSRIPANRPVAFRMPCCDSLNTPSPRFYAEIFNKTSPDGHFLTIDSSVFQLFTPADPALPRDLVLDPDGRERFRKYIPFPSFVNTIENYPYPYVIGRLCWEFPCLVPSDWEGQHIQKPNSPKTLADLKAALDAVVLKQGVFNFVFHPHGWIKSEQVVGLIDHAVQKHGRKVKFLNFREAQERLDKNLLDGQPLRREDGGDNGVRVLDLNNDGLMDVVIGNPTNRQTRLWDPKARRWLIGTFPLELAWRAFRLRVGFPSPLAPLFPTISVPEIERGHGRIVRNAHFGVFGKDSSTWLLARDAMEDAEDGIWMFNGKEWLKTPDNGVLPTLQGLDLPLSTEGDAHDRGVRLHDIDRDGTSEVIVSDDERNAIYQWSFFDRAWKRLPYQFPDGARVVDGTGREAGLRFIDLDEDGYNDVVYSNERGYGIYLFDSQLTGMDLKGWTRRIAAGKAADPAALPRITRGGMNNGFWVHSRHLWWQNEDTAKLPDLVDRRSFNDLLKDVEPRGKSPRAALEAIRVRPGFQVELAAAEPLVHDPIAFDWGADGKLWVVEMGDYPLGLDGRGKPGGLVRFLEDANGDGRYDKATVFLDGLGFPTGVLPWRNGVIVACAPDIFYAEDRNGDGKADHREVLFTGFVEGNQQHRVNGFELGLDGWIYGANGDSGGTIRSLKTGATASINGRDFRFRPDDGRFEAESGPTQYGRHRDDWGRWFGNNNPNWGWHFVLSDLDLRRNRRFMPPDPRHTLEPNIKVYPISRTLPRFNYPNAANHVTSANSPTPYRDDLFGPQFADSLFVSEPVHNLVHRMVLEPDGPTLRGHRAPDEADREFLASSDNWFRPTMLKTGPDGALWIADMDRAVIEHPEWIPDDWEAKLNLRAGSDLGRLFRVIPVDRAPRPIPRLDKLDTPGLVAALDSPNGWQRDTAQRLLLHGSDPAAATPLRRLVATTRRPKTRIQASWTLACLDALDAETVLDVLNDAEPQVRRNAIRLGAGLLKTGAAPRLIEALVRLADDPDPQVRLELASSLGETDDPRAGRALARLVGRDPGDPWLRAAVLSSATPHAVTLLTALFSEARNEGPPAEVVGPLFVLAGTLPDRQGLGALTQGIAAPAGAGGRFAPWQFAALAGLLDASERAQRPLDPEIRRSLDGLWRAARQVAVDGQSGVAGRLLAVALLGRDPACRDEDRDLLAQLLRPQVPGALQQAAVAALGRSGDDRKVPDILLAGWPAHSPPLRGAILDTLLSRDAWASALLSSLEDLCTPAAEIDPAHRERLLNGRDRAWKKRAEAVFSRNSGTRQDVVALYRTALKTTGDATAGAAVFQRLCATCHRLGGVGFEVGPDLNALQDKSPESLLAAILDPNRAREAKYTNFTVRTTDGRVLTGLIASETATSVTLRRQEGQQDVLLRTDIEEMASSAQSLMPEGMEKDLTPRDVADLIAFLARTGPQQQPKNSN